MQNATSVTEYVWIIHGGVPNVIPLIVHIAHFYFYKSI